LATGEHHGAQNPSSEFGDAPGEWIDVSEKSMAGQTVSELSAAYATCERIVGTEAKNFAYGIRILPGPKRRAMSAIYAFARRVDDIGDGSLPAAEKLAGLAEARRRVERPERFPEDPVLVALADTARRYPIDLAAFGELIDGCELDQTGATYQTWDELAVYCRDVAGSVGRLSLGVFDPPALYADPKPTLELADTLGLALQLTNILRDVREDLQNGRVYLPQQTLDEHGCTLRLLPDGTLDPQGGGLAEVIRYEARRAETLYAEGLELLPLLDWRSRGCCGALSGIYHALLGRITADPQATFGARLSLPASAKLAVAARSLAPRLPARRSSAAR
jgi:phytoene synthase